VADDDSTILALGRHVDGNVDVSFDSGCTACHGSANSAPPLDLSGASSTTLPGVGAHQSHVLGSERARAVPCNECHLVPADVLATGHMDSPLPAEVLLSDVGTYSGGACQNVACHAGPGGTNAAPIWTKVDGTQAACGTCHGLPPPPPHPLGSLNPVCNACHTNIAADNVTFFDPTKHVNGVVDY
jgi:predicted CxxxxCH...CXXCH cytochrome family protein